MRRACGSRPVVGSSKKIILGLLMSVVAMEKRCFWPPLISLNLFFALSSRFTSFNSSFRIDWFDYTIRKKVRSIQQIQSRIKTGSLQLHTNDLFNIIWDLYQDLFHLPNTSPLVFSRSVSMISSVVDLPAPLGPKQTKYLPFDTHQRKFLSPLQNEP